jgi:hypothetical protein
LRTVRKAKEAKEAANEAAEATRKSTEEQEQAEHRYRLRDDLTVRYTGKLVPANYNKARLQDVASLLDIPFAPKDTMPVLVTAIKARISGSPALQEDARFKDLDWDDSGRGRKRCGRRSACKAPALSSDDEDELEPDADLFDNDSPASGELFLAVALLFSSYLTSCYRFQGRQPVCAVCKALVTFHFRVIFASLGSSFVFFPQAQAEGCLLPSLCRWPATFPGLSAFNTAWRLPSPGHSL